VSKIVNIGIIGDYEPGRSSHVATMKAIHHAAGKLSLETRIEWVPTTSLHSAEAEEKLRQFDCFWNPPGSSYKSLSGAFQGMKIARESGRPFIGT
jgi:CTP synthase (UTP-ammonia lyase)